MEDNSPTDNGVVDNSGADDSALPDSNQPNAAEEQQDTGSGDDSRESGQDDGRQDDTTHDSGSSDADDDGLKRFAKSQGFDPDNLTDGEKRALKLAHDNQKAFRNKSQEDVNALRDATSDAAGVDEDELAGLDEDEAERIRDRNERAQDRAERRTTRFYLQNPEAMSYDTEMAEIITEEVERNGKQAASYLAADLDRLLILAKARRGDNDEQSKIEAARREERELLRQRQEAGSGASGASNSNQNTSKPKVTREWIDNGYDPSNPEHREMVDEAIARGDLY